MSLMIVFNLACEHQHLFEGWFGSADDYESQRERGLVACPVCGSKAIDKKLSAPRINLGANPPVPVDPKKAATAEVAKTAPQSLVRAAGNEESAAMQELQALWMETAKKIIATTEDVGNGFAEEARKIHYGETPERAIRGQTSADEAEALREEGIEFASFPLPAALKGPVQ